MEAVASLVEMMALDLTLKPEGTISSSAPRPPRPVMVEASEIPDLFCRFMRRWALVSSSSSEFEESSSSDSCVGGGVAGRLRMEDFDLLLRRKKGTTGAAGGGDSVEGAGAPMGSDIVGIGIMWLEVD